MRIQQVNKRQSTYFHFCMVHLLVWACLFGCIASALAEEPADKAPAASGQTATVPAPAAVQQKIKSHQKQIITDYNLHRLAFESKKKNITAEVLQERENLQRDIKRLENELDQSQQQLESMKRMERLELPHSLRERLAYVEKKISESQQTLSTVQNVNGWAASVLTPLSFILGILGSELTEKIFLLVLPLTVFNLFLFIYFRQRIVFVRHKKWLILLMVTAIIASAASLSAAEVDKRLQVEDKLRYAEDMLALTGNQKAIRILENKRGEFLRLPEGLHSGDPRFAIERKVRVNSPEYFTTLATLYLAEQQTGKAIEAITQLADKKTLISKPGPEIIISMIHFLVDRGYPDIAGKAVENYVASIGDVKTLLDLATYLKDHNMQVSADIAMAMLEKKARTTADLVVLADYYHKLGKMDKSLALLKKALQKSSKISDVILVARECVAKKADDVFKIIPTKAAKLKGTPEDLLALAKVFHEQGESDQVVKILTRAVHTAVTTKKLQELTGEIITMHQDAVMDVVREKVISLNPDLRSSLIGKKFAQARKSCIGFVDFLLQNDRREDAAQLFGAVITTLKKGRRITNSYIEVMLDLSRKALARDLKRQAVNIALHLTARIKPRSKSFSTFFRLDEKNLHSIQGLPDSSMVSIPLYQGLINEDINQLSKAEKIYISSIIFSLDRLNNSYGEKIPNSLNDFYLLGRIWQKDNRTNVLATLDRVYTLLENRLLDGLKEKERQRLLHDSIAQVTELRQKLEQQQQEIIDKKAKLRQEKERLEYQRRQLIEQMEQKIAAKEKKMKQLTGKVMVKTTASAVLLVILVGLMVGCIWLAWLYSQRMREHKFYGFCTRFLELNGWLRIFTILGILSGMILVFVSQMFQLLQKIHEITLQGVAWADYQQSPVWDEGSVSMDNADQKKKAGEG